MGKSSRVVQQLSCMFDPWPRNFHMLQVWQKKTKNKKHNILAILLISYLFPKKMSQVQPSGSQRVVPRPAVSASPGNLLNLHNPGPHPGMEVGSEALRVSRVIQSSQVLQVIPIHTESEKPCPSIMMTRDLQAPRKVASYFSEIALRGDLQRPPSESTA